MALFQSLKHRSFALLWSGQTISRLGDRLYGIALSWWVLEKTGSATAMGTVLIFAFTPMLIFLLIGGVAVDRLPRRRVMLVSDLMSGLVVLTVSMLAFSNLLEVWHIYIASMIFGFVAAFFHPAYVATVPEITPREALPSANSLTNLSGQVIGIVGPSLGALIVALGGTPIAFAVNALSFFVAAACLLFVPDSPTASQTIGELKPSFIHELRAGFRTVLNSPWLWITIVLFSLVNITHGGPLAVALPFLVKDNLHTDVSMLGLLNSMIAIGAVVTSVLLGRLTKIRRRGLAAYGASMLGGLATLAFGLPIPITGLVIMAILNGVAFSMFGLIWTNTLQEMVPRDQMGRVSSIDMLGSFVLLPVGYGVTGWATDLLGAPMVFIIGGALTMALIGLGLAHPAIRNLD